jgi:hypothetical protein
MIKSRTPLNPGGGGDFSGSRTGFQLRQNCTI